MPTGKNNPRVFADTITLDAWRTEFDDEKGEADLHIDVVFSEAGRVGGDGAPIRFRLSLERAEVRVVRDSEEVIQIRPDSVMRADLPKPATVRTTIEKKGALGAGGSVGFSPSQMKASLEASAHGGINVTVKGKQTRTIPVLEVTHGKTDTGYRFKVTSSKKGLAGQPWKATKPVLKLKDTNAWRKRGEAPEVRIEIRCLREDLVIEQIEFTNAKYPIWKKLPHLKRIAVEQYIRDELARAGLPCADLSEPFTRIILADAMPSVQQ